MINKKALKAVNDVVENGIITPKRLEELFLMALGDVLNEDKKKGKQCKIKEK